MSVASTMPASVAAAFDRQLEDDAARPALVTRSGSYSYEALDELARRACAALWALGVRPGERVAMSLPNDTDAVIAFHGCMRLGAVWVGVNRNLALPEKEWLLEDSACSVLLCDADIAESLTGPVRVVVAGPGGEWADALAGAPLVDTRPPDPHAPAGIAYTSGTTGRPKAAVHSQHNLLLPGAALVATRGYGPDLRKGDCFPLTILNMHVNTTLLVAQAGGCSIIMDRIDAEGVSEWIRRERVTTWNGPPALLHSLADRDDIDTRHLASLDEVWTGGADCPEALRARFEATFGVAVTATYGLSEAPAVVTIDDRAGGHRAGASGRALPHLDVHVVDETGARLPVGETGEICVGPVLSGPWAGAYRTMLGYRSRSEATVEALAGGVLHTGDIGFLDAEGFLFVRDRKNLVIIRGGANVYPAEVERVLGQAPGVAACAVIGTADERLGERVAAVVEPVAGAELDPDALAAYCRAELAAYKVPERFAAVEQLPRNAMGKIVRAALPELLDRNPIAPPA